MRERGGHKTRMETCMDEITKYFTSGREMGWGLEKNTHALE